VILSFIGSQGTGDFLGCLFSTGLSAGWLTQGDSQVELATLWHGVPNSVKSKCWFLKLINLQLRKGPLKANKTLRGCNFLFIGISVGTELFRE